MSFIDEDSEFEEELEDSFSDAGMDPTPAGAAAAERLKKKRMAARPSSIVQVNTSALDIHLNSLKKQLIAQKKELQNPVWLDPIKQEISHLPELQRRIEHTEMDVNAIRSAIYSKNDADLTKVVGLEASKFLLAEIEAVRVVSRRIDLHQAIEAKAFGQIADIQVGMRKLKEGITRQASLGGSGGGGGAVNSAALNDKLAVFKKELDTLHDNQVQGKSAVLLKLAESEKKNREITDEAIHRYGHKLQTGIMKFISDLKAGHNETSTKLDRVEKITHRLRELLAEKAFLEASNMTSCVIAKWMLDKCRCAFVKWRDMDPDGKRPQGAQLQRLLVKVWLKYTTHYGFNKWKSQITSMSKHELLKGHLINIVARWKSISFRDVKPYFYQWKRVAIYIGYLARESQLRKDRPAFAREPLGLIGDMVRRMGEDTDGKVLLLAGYASASALRLERVGNNLKHTDEDLQSLAKQLALQRQELTAQFTDRSELIEGQVKFFKTYASEKMEKMNNELKTVSEHVDGLMNGNTSAVMKLENRLIAMEESVAEQNKKISNLLVLNGDMLDRITTVERNQDSLKTHVETIENHFNEFELATNKTFEFLKENVKMGKDAQIFLDNNMRDLKTAVHNAVNEVKRMSDAQHILNETIELRNNDVAENLKRSNNVLNKITDHPPTPADLVKLCAAFEQRAIEAYSTAQYSTMTSAMTSELALEISLTANRLAAHVANTADMDIITSKILGPRPGPPTSTAPVMSMGNQTNSGDPPTSKYQQQANLNAARQTLGSYNSSANLKTNFNKSSAEIRESLLFAFMDEFNSILNHNQAQAVGSVKVEAQVIFKRRFLNAVELALSRIPTVNFSGNRSSIAVTSGGLGLAMANGTNCIACDRPIGGAAGLGASDESRKGLVASYARHTGSTSHGPGYLKPMTKDLNLSEQAQIDLKKQLCTPPDESIMTITRPASAGARKGSIKVDISGGQLTPIGLQDEDSIELPVGNQLVDSPHNLVKLSSGYYEQFMTDDISTPAVSHSPKRGKAGKKMQRPVTAGATRSRNRDPSQGEDGTYVLRAGYKMPLSFESDQISQALVDRFQKDISFTHSHKYGSVSNKMAVSKSNDNFRMVQFDGSRRQGSNRRSKSPPIDKRRLVPTGALLSNHSGPAHELEDMEASVERDKLIEQISNSRNNSFQESNGAPPPGN